MDAFADPVLEREYRRDMVSRHRRTAVILVWIITAMQILFVPLDLAIGDAVEIGARLGSIAVLLPIALALALVSNEGFGRFLTPLALTYALGFVGYFLAAIGENTTSPVVGSSQAAMLMSVLVEGISMGLIGIIPVRWISALACTSGVVSIIGATRLQGETSGPYFGYIVLIVVSVAVSAFTARVLVASRRREWLQARELERERARSDALLHNMLPSEIADRLKARPGAIAERFDEATVLFADLVGFTPLAEQLAPERLVALLDEVFSEFDEISDRHGLEKIKTIGDAYMVVGGVPARRDDHVAAVAAAALEMRAAIARRAPLGIRIGIHTGPVVAGVIGKRKFIYDLWGDTVNTASRMESHGAEGAIHVTAQVRERLSGTHQLEPRGKVAIKGKGELETYFLLEPTSISPSAASASMPDGGPPSTTAS